MNISHLYISSVSVHHKNKFQNRKLMPCPGAVCIFTHATSLIVELSHSKNVFDIPSNNMRHDTEKGKSSKTKCQKLTHFRFCLWTDCPPSRIIVRYWVCWPKRYFPRIRQRSSHSNRKHGEIFTVVLILWHQNRHCIGIFQVFYYFIFLNLLFELNWTDGSSQCNMKWEILFKWWKI